jgi:hypothetical protein
VPFGGAYVTVAFVHHVWEWFSHVPLPDPPPHGDVFEGVPPGGGFPMTSPAVLVLGFFLLCLVNSAAFRQAIGAFFKHSYRAFHAVVVEPVRRILQSPLLQRFFHSRPFLFVSRFLIKPLLWTGFAWLFLPKESRHTMVGTTASIFVAVNLAINSRVGRVVEEVVADWLVQTWHRFGLRAIMGLFWFLVDFFKAVLETLERLMYAVDEWLRFRSGESRATLIAKAGLGLVWFFIAYVLRFCVNVLYEPQINPIKHFPVVTVGHKMLLPLYKPFADLLIATTGVDKVQAWFISTTVIWSIPGVFGFLVWELSSNWRLYAANRRKNLFAVRVGSHGETMGRLLRPGFHSGTLPKRFAKLRRAEHRAQIDGNWHAVRKNLQSLREIETSVRRYVEREFLELFAESKCWQVPGIALKHVRLATNRVKLSLSCTDLGESNLEIVLDAESGWLVGGVTSLGWAGRLEPRQREVLVTALLGLYKSAGVDLLRQQIESLLPSPTPWYDISPAGVVVWPEGEEDVEVLYDLQEGPWVAPQSVRGLAHRTLPTVERWQLVFADVPLLWDDWVVIWNQDAAGLEHPRESAAPVRVLPP